MGIIQNIFCFLFHTCSQGGGGGGGVVSAPEIDPASAVAAITLLAGTLAVFRGRSRKS